MKSNMMEVHNVVASGAAKKHNSRKLQRARNGDSMFVLKGRPTKKFKWYHGNAECGRPSKAAPWAYKNNLPGYPSLNAFFKNGDKSLDRWLESIGVNPDPDKGQMEGIDASEFAHLMGANVTRLWYKK